MNAIARAPLPPGIFWGLSSFQMLAMFRRGLFYAYLSVYLRYHLGLSVTETTLFATLPMLANIVAQNLIWGRLSDRYQRRRTLITESVAMIGAGLLAGRLLACTGNGQGILVGTAVSLAYFLS